MGPSDGPRAGLTSKQAQHKQGDGLPVPKGRRTAKSSSLEQRLSRLQPTRPPALITHQADFPSEEEAARRAAEPLGTKTFPSPPAEARGSPIEMVSKSNPHFCIFYGDLLTSPSCVRWCQKEKCCGAGGSCATISYSGQ